MRVGLHQGLSLGGDVGPLGVQGDELTRQVGQDHPGGVGACHHHGLGRQGVDDGASPGGVAAGAVGLELGVHARPPGLAQCGGGGPGGDDLKDGVVLEPWAQDLLQGGARSGCTRAPDAVGGLVDLTGQVQAWSR